MTEAPREMLLTIPNRHVETDGGANHPPEFDASRDFVAYMPNEYGEQMVYVHPKDGEPTLYHGDNAWQAARVDDAGSAELLMHDAERLFVRACWLASRGASLPAPVGVEVDPDAGLEGIVRIFMESAKRSPNEKRKQAHQAQAMVQMLEGGGAPTMPDGGKVPKHALEQSIGFYEAWARVLLEKADAEEAGR